MRWLLIVAFLAVTVSAACALDDVEGWQATKWGMTEEQVRSAMPDLSENVPPKKFNASVYVPFDTAFKVDRFYFQVVLQFDVDTRRLGQVLVTANDASPERWIVARQLLVERYGPPHKQYGDKFVWLFPSTAIELTRYADPLLRMTNIRYYPAAKYLDDDKGKF
jgi:hypothetical protein